MKKIVAGLGAAVLASCGLFGQTAPRPAFEVASVRPSTQPTALATGSQSRVYGASCNGGPGTTDPGRLSCQSVTLSYFILMAFNLKRYQCTFPGWMDSAWFAITAKVPAGATKEQLRLMEQNLLAERFKLAVHFEEKEMQVYELTVGKNGPKLKEAPDPATPEDSAPALGPPPVGKLEKDGDGFLILPRGSGSTSVAMTGGRMRIRASGTTMEQFASFLSSRFGNPMEDATGLQGKYDITLTCSTGSVFGIAPAQGADDWGPATASVPDAVPTFSEALQQQLGLRLEQRKGPVDVLIIDHVEKVPTEN